MPMLHSLPRGSSSTNSGIKLSLFQPLPKITEVQNPVHDQKKKRKHTDFGSFKKNSIYHQKVGCSTHVPMEIPHFPRHSTAIFPGRPASDWPRHP